MALIKCPECGKDVSDKAFRCPHCDFTINAIQANAQENTTNDSNLFAPSKEKKRIPLWTIVLIIVGSLTFVGGIVLFCVNSKSLPNCASQIDSIVFDTIGSLSTEQEDETTNCGITKVNGEWFMSHCATEHIILTEDMKCKCIRGLGCVDEEIIEGTYTLKDSVLVLYLDNGKKLDGNIVKHDDEIYLSLDGWYIPTDNCFLSESGLQKDYSWMNGEWYLTSSINDPYVGRINIRLTLNIDAKSHTIRLTDEDSGDGYSGTYTVNENQNMISCNGNCVHYDPNKKLFYEEFQGKRDYYHKYNSNEGENGSGRKAPSKPR